jgi:hypothetical protein
MSTLLYGMVRDPAPLAPNDVRSTAPRVQHDSPPAEQSNPPEPNEVETDHNPNLGMVNRQLASDWHKGEQFTPSWIPEVDANHELNDRVNRQVSTSGTAAAREAAGRFGHGSASYAIGIEPTSDLVDGGKMTNEYFHVEKPAIQQTMTDSMTIPLGTDGDARGDAMFAGRDAARDAGNAGMYAEMYRNLMGGT